MRRLDIKPLIVLIVLIHLCVTLLAQEDQPFPQVFSPNAAELMRYGKIPVNHYTGIPEISIPLTEFNARNYKIPVYLSYYAGGNKPDQHPGWAGMGWSLHAGGSISRVVRGIKDEEGASVYNGSLTFVYPHNRGHFFHFSDVQDVDWMNTSNLNEILVNTTYFNDFDYEPDEFYVSVDGLNAKFFFTGENEIKISSSSDAYFTASYTVIDEDEDEQLVLYDGQNGLSVPLGQYISEIRLLSKDGTCYVFGGDLNSIEFSARYNIDYDSAGITMNSGRWIVTANTWNLSTIIRPDGEKIFFDYKRDGIPVSLTDSHYLTYFEYGSDMSVLNSSLMNQDSNLHFSFLVPSYLNQIHCESGEDELAFASSPSSELGYGFSRESFMRRHNLLNAVVDTVYSNNHYLKLDSIITRQGANVVLDYTSSSNTRLKLMGVSIIDNALPCMEYAFTYNQTALPSYNSRKTNLWGDYALTSPYSFLNTDSINSTRNVVNSELAKAEILTRIDYPTGGWTEFEYEPNDFSKVVNQAPFQLVNQTGLAGGLRIKTIRDYSAPDKPQTRNYSYFGINNTSSGILGGFPSYYEEGYHSASFLWAGWVSLFIYLQSNVCADGTWRMASESPLIQSSMTNGCYVTYSSVTESRPGGGKTKYEFYNHDSSDMDCMDHTPANLLTDMAADDTGRLIEAPFSSMSLYRGLLKKRTDYDNADIKVREETRQYVQDTTKFVKAVSRETYFNYFRRGLYYKHFTGYPALSSKIVSTYSENGSIPVTEDYHYEYDDYRNLTRVFKRVWGYGIDETRIVYSGDTLLSGQTSVYAQMKAVGILDRPVETLHLKNNKIIAAELTTYRKEGSLFVPDKDYSSSLNEPVEPFYWEFYHPNRSLPGHYCNPVRQYLNYDAYGNPRVVLDEATGGSQIKWGLGGVRPVASFKGAGPRILMTQTVGDSYKYQSLRNTSGRCVLVFFEASATGTAEMNLMFDEGESRSCYVKLDTDSTYYYHPYNNNHPPGVRDNFFYTVQNVSPGSHVFQIALSPEDFYTEIPEYPMIPPGINYFQADANIVYPVQSYSDSVVVQPTYYYDFESDGNYSGGFESEKARSGYYPVSLSIPSDASYRIDWMEKTGGIWHYKSEPFTGSKILGSGVSAIDNIRVYPAGAAAQTWTWWPTGDLRSETNERGETVRYSYDGLGRLAEVRDKDGNKRTEYEYGYNLPDNIIRTKQYTSAGINPESQITEQYFDGLGRPSSVIRKAASPLQNSDLTETFEYDTLGRKVRQSLPIPSLQPSFYGAAEEPYTKTLYDNSPLDRPVAEFGPGKAWHDAGKAVRKKFLTNDFSDSLKCVKWSVNWTNDTTLVVNKDGWYSHGVLRAEHITDEDGHTIIRFKDMTDKPILDRSLMRTTGNTINCIDTYYIYDDFDRLAAVLPPELSRSLASSNNTSWNSGNTLVINEYAYLYRYNARGLCIAQKLPGCGWTYMVYDRNRRLVFTQDAVNRPWGEWKFVICDDLGRECIRGHVRDRNMDPFVDPMANFPVRAIRSDNAANGYAVTGYSNQSQTVHSVTWWDDYRFLGQWGVPSGTDPRVGRTLSASEMTAYGLPTGSKDFVFSTPNGFNYLWSVHYYDDFGREVQTNAKYLQGVEKETRTYDFSGNVTARSLSHMDADGQVVWTENYTYGYDSWGRSTTTAHRLGANGTQVCLSDNSYDAVGRLTSRQRASNAALTESLRYNVRSWLDSISVGTNGSTFSQLMYYNRPHPSGGTTRTWSGNISAIDWRSGSDIGTSSYKYSYDGLSRLKSATHRPAAGFNVFKSWTYDRQGNITAEGGNISYTLAGNQMTRKTISVEEAFIDPGPFIPDPFVLEPEPEPFIPEPIGHGDPVITPVDSLQGPIIPVLPGEIIYEYTYDANGRMVSDSERGIQRIRYNVLDLPSRVEFSNDTIPDIYYLYAADGRKLEQGTIHSTNGTHFGDIQYIYTPHITYQGNQVYVDGVLDRILFEGGYISAADNVYHFFVIDHLGSVRVVAKADGTIEKCYDYDPYGSDLNNNQNTTVPAINPYKFNGKEFVQRLNHYDFGARLFGPSIRRWTTMDPLCEKYYSWSPYAYCAGNPVNIVDPNGQFWDFIWDVVNVVMDAVNIWKDIKEQNWKATAVDSGGLVLDALAAAIPFVPAGAGATLEAAKTADKAVDALRTADKAHDASTAAKAVHANSAASTKAQHAYDIVVKESGEPVKTGVSSGPVRKDGKSYRAESQVRKWNKEAGYEKYESIITHTEPEGVKAREHIYDYEKNRADELKKRGFLVNPKFHKRP